MVRCPSCTVENIAASKYCSVCGAALRPEDAATIAQTIGNSSPGRSSLSSTANSSLHGRFLPGTMIADRYRVVSLVGKGGMGEVYRADDLKLGQTVALKFLPKDFADNPQRQEYFLSEVRLTRQISHPNVCRVYDVAEADHQQFLSMEYIDGEDLRTLLRRIGKLPQDKGIQIAQQLCAGLAAAHNRGVLHRDLKPANIMIDGRGHVRIMDFGLARLVADNNEAEVAGTPAYMAPEQLTRGEATVQSDLFAIGLILAEVFTGQPVLSSGSIQDLIRAHDADLSQSLKFGDDINPIVQSVIRRCLEREPQNRPASARAIAAGLPGGDPLEAALAAGETPSPEMVAASGDSGQLSLKWAGILLAVALTALAILVPIICQTAPTHDLKGVPQTYAAFSQNILEKLGLLDPNSYIKWGYAETAEKSPKRMEFWYRQSPKPLFPLADAQKVGQTLQNSLGNPPPVVPGMVSLRMHRNGKLRELLVIQPERITANQKIVSDLQLLKLAQVIPEDAISYESFYSRVLPDDKDFTAWSPPVFADERYSFIPRPQDTVPGMRALAVLEEDIRRIDVGRVAGSIVFFHLVDDSAPTPQTIGSIQIKDAPFGASMSLIVTFAAILLAWRNMLAGRSDLRGARRLAVCMFVIAFAETAFSFAPQPGLLMAGMMTALSTSARVWIYYVAVEPLARRIWPEMLVTWSRALAGRIHDPGVGRDILYGTVSGILFTLFAFGLLYFALAPKTDPDTLCGLRFLLSQLMRGLRAAVTASLQIGVLMVLVRALVRNQWMPILVATLFVLWNPEVLKPLLATPSYADVGVATGYIIFYLVTAILLARYGVLAAGAFRLGHDFFLHFPWGWEGPALSGTIFAVIGILTCIGYGFYWSVGGHAAFTTNHEPTA